MTDGYVVNWPMVIVVVLNWVVGPLPNAILFNVGLLTTYLVG